MRHTVYFVGAGLSKALQKDSAHPVPLLTDFVKVASHYAATENSNVSMLTLAGLERLGRFRWKSTEALRLARAFDPDARDERLIARFVDVLRRRPSESIEDLLAREDRGATFGEAAIFDTSIRFRYAISRIFATIGWNVQLAVLETYLQNLFRSGGRHTFVSFNYDLFLDHAISRIAPTWHWHCGYGFEIPYCTARDPHEYPVDVDLANVHDCQSHIQLLKPHGSLNWLLPVERASHVMPFTDGPTTIRVDGEGRPAYLEGSDLWRRVIYRDELATIQEVGPGIVVPLRRKDATLRILKDTRAHEFRAVSEADEAVILGWSMPATDEDQRSLIRYAASLRAKPFERVVAVNLNQPPEYFQRIAETFLVEESVLDAWNDGFDDYAVARAG